MIRDLKSLYVAIVDNEVVVFETNLKLFIEELGKIESEIRNYDYYYRQFKKSSKQSLVNSNSKKYYLQKIL
ncbi:hypothetical protein [Kordia sp.]|uniref:hypothetical protein n=1 Tax=Kordia sp. TaxID=1965332 RepID=UPI003D6AADAA